jgi:hypothetical protein
MANKPADLAGRQGFGPAGDEQRESPRDHERSRAATNEAEGRVKWLGVRDHFRNWLLTEHEARAVDLVRT